MCLIIARYAGKHVKQRYLKAAWEANDDGAGIMFTHNRQVHILKGLMTLEDFMTAWKSVPEDLPTVAHFRIRTHGKSDKDNTHPFEVFPGQLGLAHNGILPIKAEGDMSDTATFVDLVLKKLPVGWHRSPAMLHLIDGYCGTGNKLALLDAKGKITIVNEEAGQVEEGVWYSNYSFRGWNRTAYGQFAGHWKDNDEYTDHEYPIGTGYQPFQQTTLPTTGGAAGGADGDAAGSDDALLESSAIELDLRGQAREAREAGKELEANKLQSAADAVRDERIAWIRERTAAENGGRSLIKRVTDGVKKMCGGD